jgi:phosphoheptose isomerase
MRRRWCEELINGYQTLRKSLAMMIIQESVQYSAIYFDAIRPEVRSHQADGFLKARYGPRQARK